MWLSYKVRREEESIFKRGQNMLATGRKGRSKLRLKVIVEKGMRRKVLIIKETVARNNLMKIPKKIEKKHY